MHDGQFRTEIAVTRWTRCFPFERRRMPWIVRGGTLAGPNAHEEIRKKDDLSGRQEKRRDRDEDVQHLLRLKKNIVRGIVDSSHLSTDSQNVHREEDAIDADEARPEVHLAER